MAGAGWHYCGASGQVSKASKGVGGRAGQGRGKQSKDTGELGAGALPVGTAHTGRANGQLETRTHVAAVRQGVHSRVFRSSLKHVPR